MKEQDYKDFMLLWDTYNSPMKAGHKWCTYTRESVDESLAALKRLLLSQGFKFEPLERG